jgi:hypothetical protein
LLFGHLGFGPGGAETAESAKAAAGVLCDVYEVDPDEAGNIVYTALQSGWRSGTVEF